MATKTRRQPNSQIETLKTAYGAPCGFSYEVDGSTANLSFADDQQEQLDFNKQNYRVGNITVQTGSQMRAIIQEAGVYSLKVSLSWAAAANMSDGSMTVRVNGVQVKMLFEFANNISNRKYNGSCDLKLNVGDYVEIWAHQNDSTGAARSVATTAGYTYWDMHKVFGT